MKFLFLVILIPVFALSQDIPKNANTLVIHGVGFSQVGNTLLDSGFRIDKLDKEFGTIETEYKKLCNDCLPSLFIFVRVKDSVSTFSGEWRSNGDPLSLLLYQPPKWLD